MKITIFTDGGGFKNKKTKSGYDGVGAYSIWFDDKEVVAGVKFLPNGTNNYSEMYGIFKSLQIIYKTVMTDKDMQSKHRDITIRVVTDSELCINILTNWLYGWLLKSENEVLTKSDKSTVINQELIKSTALIKQIIEAWLGKPIEFCHINSHKSKSNLKKDMEKFNNKNGTNLSIDEYEFYYMCNAKCDAMVKERYEIGK